MDAARGVGDAYGDQCRDDRRFKIRRRCRPVRFENIADLLADSAHRIERSARILEDDADFSTAQLAPSIPENVGSIKLQTIGVELRCGIEDPRDGMSGERFS